MLLVHHVFVSVSLILHFMHCLEIIIALEASVKNVANLNGSLWLFLQVYYVKDNPSPTCIYSYNECIFYPIKVKT